MKRWTALGSEPYWSSLLGPKSARFHNHRRLLTLSVPNGWSWWTSGRGSSAPAWVLPAPPSPRAGLLTAARGPPSGSHRSLGAWQRRLRSDAPSTSPLARRTNARPVGIEGGRGMAGHNVGTFLRRARSGRGCSARASAGDRAVAAQGGLASPSRLQGSSLHVMPPALKSCSVTR
jgi:hypothetical protein